MSINTISRLVKLFARLPGLGPRSARRAIFYLISKQQALLLPMIDLLQEVEDKVVNCSLCGNIDVCDPCSVCSDKDRDASLLCIIENVGDLWAVERMGDYKGNYYVLGGRLSSSMTASDLNLDRLLARIKDSEIESKTKIKEVILATSATSEGQMTALYVSRFLSDLGIKISRLSYGLPLGGELDYLDEGTLSIAINNRRPFD